MWNNVQGNWKLQVEMDHHS